MSKAGLQPNVLIVEDDETIVTLLMYTLEKHHYSTKYVRRGDQAVWMAEEMKPDLILLDWMLPGKHGVDVCKELRAKKETKDIPIIMISARGEEADKVKGLNIGVDDYLVKPVSPKELMARVEALLRRAKPALVTQELAFGDIKMNLDMHAVYYRDTRIELGPTEYNILQYLMQHPNRIFSREQLIQAVWGYDKETDVRTVDVHINRLRTSMGMDKKKGTVIRTVRSAGYCLAIEEGDEEDEAVPQSRGAAGGE
jgi:two-component system phosphate regulon response regulator PhoB